MLQVNSVRMRRHLLSKDFKGSVFVEFDNSETSDKVHIWTCRAGQFLTRICMSYLSST